MTDDESPADERSPNDGDVSAELWEAVGREAIADLLRNQRDAVVQDIEEAVSAIEYGATVDEVHVQHLRDSIETLEVTVEERLVSLVDGMEPWERTVGRVPYGRMYDALEIDRDDVNHLLEQQEESKER